jgi:hypothetical protein
MALTGLHPSFDEIDAKHEQSQVNVFNAQEKEDTIQRLR